MLKQYIQEALKGFTAPKKSCSCGCGGCSDSQPKLALLESKTPISEGLRYHIENGISLQENVFRIGSKKYLQLFAEARMLLEWGNISLDENSKFLIENTDIGKFGIYEGEKVPLDLPKLNEYKDEPSYDGPNPPIIAVRVDDEKFLDDLEDEGIDHGYDDAQDPDEGPDIGFRYIIYGKKEEKQDIIAFLNNLMKPYGNDVRIDNESVNEAKKKKKKKKDPPLGKPKRGGSKAYYVYVRDPKTKNIKKVSFGSGGLRAKIKDPKARSAFAARHKCSQKKDRTKASYWSCNLPRYAPALGLGPKMNTYW